MLLDARAVTASEGAGAPERAVASFLRFIENRLDVRVVRDNRGITDAAMRAPFRLATLLKKSGIITGFEQIARLPDEPPLHAWRVHYAVPDPLTTAGASLESSAAALTAALAEALERYLWMTQRDYLSVRTASEAGIAAHGVHIALARFAGYAPELRAKHGRKPFDPDAAYAWVRGESLIDGRVTYLPAQAVSGLRGASWHRDEPPIRQSTTNGLATWGTQAGARLAGIHELLEREAYLTMWLNQLSLSRYSLSSLAALDPALGRVFATCERYRIRPHVVSLLTDAPTHAIAVVLEDMSAVAPRFAIGMRSHRSLPDAVRKALTEALRARQSVRTRLREGATWDASMPIEGIGHRDRLEYWSVPAHAARLEFLIAGPEIAAAPAAWDADDEQAHLDRLVRWCADKGFGCVAIPLTHAAKNPTDLHVTMVVIPELQPMYLAESHHAFARARLRDIPRQAGYAPRAQPFLAAPHPFS